MHMKCLGVLCVGWFVGFGFGFFFSHSSYEKTLTIKPAYLLLRVGFVIYPCVRSTNPPSVQKLPISAVVFVVEGIWTTV